MRTILVFYDTLNRDFLPCYNKDTDTIAPNFERLAKHCVQFDNSYVGSMPCIPARRELHTGRYNFLHREWGPLEPFDDSLPEILKEHGIETHLISDHLHYWEDGGANYHTRYSSWQIIRGQEGDFWKGDIKMPEIPEVVKVPSKQQGGGITGGWKADWVNRTYIKEEKDFPQTQCFDLGIEYIEKNHNEDNWFLHLETFDPHEPFYVPQKYLDMYRDDYNGKHYDWPRGVVTESEDEIRHIKRQYQALITMCDYNLGRILDMMDKYDMWKDTMLIVGTDHGFLLGEHGFWGKNQMPYYNEIAHTPLFIWDPKAAKKDVHRETLVQMIDWMPTILAHHGVAIPKDVQGKDLHKTISSDLKIRDSALYGVFSGHVNITDTHYVYMRSAKEEYKDEVYNYTLMPLHMKSRFSPKELKDIQLVKPFKFSKDVPLLKIKSYDKYNVARFGTKLFDIDRDPKQENPIEDKTIEERMKKTMVRLMEETDAPDEQYLRLGLEDLHSIN